MYDDQTQLEVALYRWEMPNGTQGAMTIWPDGTADVSQRPSAASEWQTVTSVHHMIGTSLASILDNQMENQQ